MNKTSVGISHKLVFCNSEIFNVVQGHGYHISVEGGQVSDAPWNNISSQGFQPFLKFTGNPSPDTIEVFVE